MSDRHSDFESYGIDQLVDEDCGVFVGGMTLRDWFAGQALPEAMRWAFNNANDDFLPEEWASKIAFATADAMLAEREGGAS